MLLNFFGVLNSFSEVYILNLNPLFLGADAVNSFQLSIICFASNIPYLRNNRSLSSNALHPVFLAYG